MLVNYWIDIFTEEKILYKFSTADKEGYIRCLDGSSFSSISQQNAIVRGGELSTMGKVEITIMSEDIIEPLDYNGGDLLGAYVSMYYQLGETDARTVFNKMQVVEFAQKSENSFVLSLEDSTFAKTGLVTLAQPEQMGDSGELSTCIGEQVWVPLNKIGGIKNLYSQGKTDEPSEISEGLNSESQNAGRNLSFWNSKPTFIKTFYAMRFYEKRMLVFDNNLEDLINSTLEIYAGKGAGDKYRITNEDSSRIELDRDFENKIHTSGEYLKQLPLIDSEPSKNKHPRISIALNSNGTLYDLSCFRICDKNNLYAALLWNKMQLGDNAILEMPDGSFKRVVIYKTTIETGKNHKIIAITNSNFDGEKIRLKGFLSQSPRYDVSETDEGDNFTGIFWRDKSTGISIPIYFLGRGRTLTFGSGSSEDKVQIQRYIDNGDQAPLYSASSVNPQEVFRITYNSNMNEATKVAVANAFRNALGIISVYWRLDTDELKGLDIDSIYPTFEIATKGINWVPKIKIMLLNDRCTVMEVKDFEIEINENLEKINRLIISGLSLIEGREDLYSNTMVFPSPMLGIPDTVIDTDTEAIQKELLSKLRFSGDSIKNAKFLYLQIGIRFLGAPDAESTISFMAGTLNYEFTSQLDKVRIEAHRESNGDSINNFLKLAQVVCKDNDININEPSFDKVNLAVEIWANNECNLEVSNGIRWEDKLSELCRAANFSLFSDGGSLYAKYWAADRNKEVEWIIGEKDIVANSYDITSPESGYIATDYHFSVPTENGIKTLSISFSPKESSEENEFPDENTWKYASSWELTTRSPDNSHYNEFHYKTHVLEAKGKFKGGLQIAIDTTADFKPDMFVIGNLYEISSGETKGKFRLLDITLVLRLEIADCIFERIDGNLILEDDNWQAIIRPLKNQEEWKEMFGGNYNELNHASAQSLWELSKEAFDTIKRCVKMDERYTKHKVMAFTNPYTWLISILNTVRHNKYKKVLVKFSVPLDMLPEGEIYELLLKRVRLEFGWFKKRPINGWIIGYSLNVAEDKVDLTFVSSEPMKDIKWYDENYPDEPTVLDETENTDKIIVEA